MKIFWMLLMAISLAASSIPTNAEEPASDASFDAPALPSPAKIKAGTLVRDQRDKVVLESSQDFSEPNSSDPYRNSVSSETERAAQVNRDGEEQVDRLLETTRSNDMDYNARTGQRAEAQSADLRVCPATDPVPGCKYYQLADAVKAAKPGDTIVLSPGIYDQGAKVDVANLTIMGEPGAHIKGGAVGGKAALVVTAPDVVIDGLECSHIEVRDRNGACIRVEGDDLTVRNVYFHDSQNGILSGPGGGTLLIEDSIFKRNGYGGRAHGVYIGKHVETFVFRNSQILETKGAGHGFKSRAKETIIENSIIASLDGHDSRAIDIAKGGQVIIRGNIFEKGPNSENWQMIGLALEGKPHEVNSTLIEDNIFIFDLDPSQWMNVLKDLAGIKPVKGMVVFTKSPADVVLRNNVIVGAKKIGDGVIEKDNQIFPSRWAADMPAYPWLPEVDN